MGQQCIALHVGVSEQYVGPVSPTCSRLAERAVPTITAATQESLLSVHGCHTPSYLPTLLAVVASADVVFTHTAPLLPSLHGEKSPVSSPCYIGNSITVTRNIGPVNMHLAPLHSSNHSPTHSDLVDRLHDAWLWRKCNPLGYSYQSVALWFLTEVKRHADKFCRHISRMGVEVKRRCCPKKMRLTVQKIW